MRCWRWELIKGKAKQDVMEEQRKQQELRQQYARQREHFKLANEELKAYNEELKRKEAAELLKIEDYAIKKERMELLRKDKENQKIADK